MLILLVAVIALLATTGAMALTDEVDKLLAAGTQASHAASGAMLKLRQFLSSVEDLIAGAVFLFGVYVVTRVVSLFQLQGIRRQLKDLVAVLEERNRGHGTPAE